jgi:methylase of polypeptide subunit release factors
VSKYSSKLKIGGMLSFELGENQFDDVKAMMTEKGFVNIKEFLDLGNIQRAINGTYLL